MNKIDVSKRFWLFTFPDYGSCGGLDAYCNSFETKEGAEAYFKDSARSAFMSINGQVFDRDTGEYYDI